MMDVLFKVLMCTIGVLIIELFTLSGRVFSEIDRVGSDMDIYAFGAGVTLLTRAAIYGPMPRIYLVLTVFGLCFAMIFYTANILISRYIRRSHLRLRQGISYTNIAYFVELWHKPLKKGFRFWTIFGFLIGMIPLLFVAIVTVFHE